MCTEHFNIKKIIRAINKESAQLKGELGKENDRRDHGRIQPF